MKGNHQSAHCSGVCIYDNQLYISALTNPPERILTKGYFVHDGVKVDLDVSGLANPWVEPGELTASDCTVETCKFGDNEVAYRLKVRFVKGGAEDYACEWNIYQDKSLRMNISYLDDEGN